MTAAGGGALPGWLRDFPGAVVHVAADGTVVASNGRLEAELGRALVGAPFAAALDGDSCGGKWARILAAAGADAAATVEELILRGDETLAEPRAFSVLREAGVPGLRLVEHPRDPRLGHLRELAGEVNAELVDTQRTLLREQGRLARALEELEARRAELERSNRALDEFAHAVSHDLKAPLRSIGNYARWIAEDAGPALGEESAAHLARLQAQVERMRALIDGILAYARAGRERWEPEAVDVGALAREVVATLDPPPGVTVTVEAGLPTLEAERAPLRQVLQNLIGNAVAHVRPEGGQVRVSGRPAPGAPGFHELAVADDGPGIPAELQARIWELFHALAPPGAGDGQAGTGIGLALVRRLVEGHGGAAWVESVEGAGATFRVRWPTRVHGRV